MKGYLFEESKIVLIHTDGGSRGNPGEAAIGVVVEYEGGKKIYGEKIGIATNNIAEYSAVVFALKKVKQLLGKAKAKELTLAVNMDSELIVRQLNGVYKIEEPHLQPFFMQVWNLRLDFKSVKFSHIPRERNKEADKALNQALDG